MRFRRKSPEDEEFQLGAVALSKKDSAKAARHFRKALSINPNHVDSLVGLGIALSTMNAQPDIEALQRSIEEFDKALAIKKKNPIAWYNRGLSFFKMGKFEKAIESFRMALKYNQKFSIVWAYLGEAYYHVGNYDEASFCASRAIKLNPTLTEKVSSWYTEMQKKINKE